MSYKQIADKLRISENTVDSQIRHALDFLRDEYRKISAMSVLWYFFHI
jgi:DNA-directed RNA polymerase specialized sigma24 family protein